MDVQEINLNNNKITGSGVKKVAPYIQFTNLRRFYFEGNHINGIAIREFATYLYKTQLIEFSMLKYYCGDVESNKFLFLCKNDNDCDCLINAVKFCCYYICFEFPCFCVDEVRICRENNLYRSEKKEVKKNLDTVIDIITSNLIESFDPKNSIQSRYYSIARAELVVAKLDEIGIRNSNLNNLKKAVGKPEIIELKRGINKDITEAAVNRLSYISKNKCCYDVAKEIIYEYLGDSAENCEDIFLPMIFSQNSFKAKVNDAACGPLYLSFC